MLMHLVNNLVKKELREWGREVAAEGSIVLPKDLFCKCLKLVVLSADPRSQGHCKPFVPGVKCAMDALRLPDILSEMHEDALTVHNTCFFPSIFSLLFFLPLGRDSYFLLLYTHWIFLFPYLLPSSFQLPFVWGKKREKDDFFLSTSLLYCQSLPSSVEWPLALSCLNCCSSSQDVSEIKFSGAHSVSFVSSLFAWEGAMDIYSTAVVVMVTGEERGSAWTFLCWNFVLFFSFFPMYFRRNSLGWEGKLKVI